MKKATLLLALCAVMMTACAQQPKADKSQTKPEDTTATAPAEAKTLAPDFTLNDINGNPLALSSLRGKYVIIDFWGSWCIWCIRGIPKMKEYYAKYKDKMEILGVDCNDPEAKWKAAVKEHDIPWLHVYNPRSSNLLQTYAIQGFPTKVVVDPQGNLVHTVIGEDPAFYEYLDNLFR